MVADDLMMSGIYPKYLFCVKRCPQGVLWIDAVMLLDAGVTTIGTQPTFPRNPNRALYVG